MACDFVDEPKITFDEDKLEKCLRDLESGKGVIQALIEIKLMTIPTRLTQTVLCALEKYKNGTPTAARYCKIITRRLEGKKGRNKKNHSLQKEEQSTSSQQQGDPDIICLDPDTEVHEISPNKVRILNDLKRGLYYRRPDEKSDPIPPVEKAPKSTPEPKKVENTPSPPNRGLGYSGRFSAFRPIGKKRSPPPYPLRLHDIQRTPYYQKIYQQVVQEKKNSDDFLDEMTQINYPHFGLLGFGLI